MKQKLYPECVKLLQQSNTHSTLNEFIEWLYDNGFSITHYERKSHVNIETIIYDFMQVDARILEKERREMLSNLSKLNKQP